MTSVEENTSPPEWLIRLEKKEKPHRLAHEIGAGSPCLKCGDKCPGLDLHFWRKLCRNCKCKKEDHDVIEDDNYSQFNILFGSSVPKNSIKPKKAVLELCLKNGKEHNVPLDWTPPNIPSDLAKAYMERLPQDKVPISNSDGAVYRRQQLEKQIPLHDFDPKLCHELTPAESKHLEEYATNVRNSVVGQGRVVRIPVVRGFTSSSTEVPSAKTFRTVNVSGSNDPARKVERNEFPIQNQKWISERCGENPLDSGSRSSSPMRGMNLPKEGYFVDIVGKDASYQRIYNNPDYERSSALNHSVPNYSKELTSNYRKDPANFGPKDSVLSTVRNPMSYLEFSEAMKNQKPHSVYINNKSNQFTSFGNPYNFQTNVPSDIYNNQKKLASGDNQNEVLNMDNSNYLVDSDEGGPRSHKPFLEQTKICSEEKDHDRYDTPYGNEFHAPNSAHYSVTKSLPTSYLEHSKDLENKNPSFSAPFRMEKVSFPGNDSQVSIEQREGSPSNFNYINQGQNKISAPIGSQLGSKLGDHRNRIDKDSKQSSPNTSLQNFSNFLPSEVEITNEANQLGRALYKDPFDNESGTASQYLLAPQSDDDKIYHGLESLSMKEDINCIQCEKEIEIGCIAVVVQKKGKTKAWHPECFICNTCEELLVDLLYFYHKGKVYCGRDYAKICEIPRCYACDELIFMKSYTQAEGQSFHLRHFCCLECDTPLADKEYLPMNGHPICLPCYDEHYAKRCHNCSGIISATEKTVRLNDFSWHANEQCFSCHQCVKVSGVGRSEGVLPGRVRSGEDAFPPVGSRGSGPVVWREAASWTSGEAASWTPGEAASWTPGEAASWTPREAASWTPGKAARRQALGRTAATASDREPSSRSSDQRLRIRGTS